MELIQLVQQLTRCANLLEKDFAELIKGINNTYITKTKMEKVPFDSCLVSTVVHRDASQVIAGQELGML